MANTATPTTVKNETRAEVFEVLCNALAQVYGLENVHKIGDTEIAVEVAKAPTGEPIYATFSPTIKDYCDRVTKTKTIKAFNLTAECNAYSKVLISRKEKVEKTAENKSKKIAADKARREANAKAKAEHAKLKAEKTDKGIEALERMMSNYAKNN